MLQSLTQTNKLVPRKYQIEGADFLWNKKRALLFDDPGLGKTLQAAMATETPALVACPTYLVEQWATFINNQFPSHKVVYSSGGTQTQRLKALNSDDDADWLIVNIEMLRTYNFPSVRTFIIDEAHHVRSRNAQQSKAAFDIAQGTPRVYLLTGTPIYKEADDLYMLLKIIAPAHFTSYYRFVQMFCRVEENPWRNRIIGVHSTSSIRRMLSHYAIGRSYKDVGLQLPNLIEQEIKIAMPPRMKEAYNKMKNEYRLMHITFSNAGALLQALRAVTNCKEKLEAAKSLIDDNSNTRTVVFCWFVTTAEALGKILKAPVITGEMKVTDRVKIAQGDHKVIIATMASLSEGVDLSAYKMLIFFEEDYTPGMMYQALSRVQRYSADVSPVRAFYLMMKATVDETVHKRRSSRDVTAKDILEEAING